MVAVTSAPSFSVDFLDPRERQSPDHIYACLTSASLVALPRAYNFSHTYS